MTLEELDNYIVIQLRVYNLQPEGVRFGNYKRWFKTIARPRPDSKQPAKFATVLVNFDENIPQEQLQQIIYQVAQQHEQALK